MTYLASLLRQSGTRVGDAPPTLGPRPSAGIEVDALREVAPAGSTPAPVAAATEHAPRALRPVRFSAASEGSPSTALPRVVVGRPAAEQPANPKPDRPTVTPRLSDHEERGVSRDEQVLQQVAEVVAWVAAGANTDQPEQPSDVVVPPADAPLTHVAASTRESPPGKGLFPAQADEPDEPAPRVTVGTIEVTVEAPEPAPPTAPPPAPVQPPAAPDVSRLTRHYIGL